MHTVDTGRDTCQSWLVRLQTDLLLNHVVRWVTRTRKRKEPPALMSVKVESWEQSISACMFWLWNLIFLKAFLMVITSVNGGTLPASRNGRLWNTATVCIHSAGAFLYYLIACCQWGYSCRAKCFFFTCDAWLCDVSRWTDSESSIVCLAKTDLLQAWKRQQWMTGKKRSIHYPKLIYCVCVFEGIYINLDVIFHFSNSWLVLFARTKCSSSKATEL